jgi:predicted DNA-binding protein
MLTHRTNVLLSPDEYGMLLALSREHGRTMGELVRHAVKKTYGERSKDSFFNSLERIRQMTKGIKIKKSEYRSLVVEGRRYED